MVRQRKRKHSWNPYTSEVQRFSVYPKISVGSEDSVKVGDTIVVSIDEVDERGRGYASYKGRRVIVYNASLGSTVRARVVKVSQESVLAETIETLSESSVEY